MMFAPIGHTEQSNQRSIFLAYHTTAQSPIHIETIRAVWSKTSTNGLAVKTYFLYTAVRIRIDAAA